MVIAMTVKIKHHFHLGILPLAYSILSSLKFPQIVERYAPSGPKQIVSNGLTLTSVVLNRLTAADPLYKVDSWAFHSGLHLLVPIDPTKLNDDRIGRTFDAVSEHLAPIFLDFSRNVISQYNVKLSEVHADGTSLYFEGVYEDDEEFITRGYSHDGHQGKIQVHPLLVTTADGGLPLYYSLHPGNALDKKILLPALGAFIEQYKNIVEQDKTIIIGDRGTISKKNAIKMNKRGLKFLGAVKLDGKLKKALYSIPEDAFRESTYRPASKRGGLFYVAEIPVELSVGKESVRVRGIAVISENKRKNDIAAINRVVATVQEGLMSIKAKLGRRHYREVKEVKAQIRKLFSRRYKKYRSLFDITIVEEGGRVVDLRWSIRKDEESRLRKAAGRYLLITSDEGRTADELLAAYKNRARSIEYVFKELKNELHIRPVYLKNLERIHVLVFVTVIAAILMLLIKRQYRIAGRKERYWRRLNELFCDVAVSEIEEGGIIKFAVSEYNRVHNSVFEALRVKPPPLLVGSKRSG